VLHTLQQASVPAYVDAFKALGWLFLALLPLLLVVPAGEGGSGPVAAH
jgi:hypothetical protein